MLWTASALVSCSSTLLPSPYYDRCLFFLTQYPISRTHSKRVLDNAYLEAHPSLGESEPSKTTKAAFKATSPKMLMPMSAEDWIPPKHDELPVLIWPKSMYSPGIVILAEPTPKVKDGRVALQGKTYPPAEALLEDPEI